MRLVAQKVLLLVASHLRRGGLSWATNPLEQLPAFSVVVALCSIWGTAALIGFTGGACMKKTPKEELWPILRSGLPPIPWGVLKTFCFVTAFPCIFLRYLNIVWAERSTMQMLPLCFLTGLVSFMVFVGHVSWTLVSRRTREYRTVIHCTMTFCACSIISAPMISSFEASHSFPWATAILTAAAIFAAVSVRPIGEAVMSAQQDWVDFSTPRTAAQRLQALDSQKLYATAGILVYTLVTSGALQLTAATSGGLVFFLVVSIAAISAGCFYEFCVPHKAVEALTDQSTQGGYNSQPATPREGVEMEGTHAVSRGLYVFGLGHAIFGICAALSTLLFGLHATQALGLPIILIGCAHAMCCLFEMPVLRFEPALRKVILPEVMWGLGVLGAALRLFLYTFVDSVNGVWLLLCLEMLGGISEGLVRVGAGRLVQKYGKSAPFAVHFAIGEVSSFGWQAVGCVIWGSAWKLGFYVVYCTAAIILSITAAITLSITLWQFATGRLSARSTGSSAASPQMSARSEVVDESGRTMTRGS